MLTDFQNSFTDTLSGKFAIRSLWNISPHLRCVTTLPCEIFTFRNCLFLLKNMLSKLLHATVGVSKLGYTSLIFVDPGVKVNVAYYRNVLLLQQLLPTIRQVSGNFFIFQLDSAPSHRALRQSVFWNVRHLRLSRQNCGPQTAQT